MTKPEEPTCRWYALINGLEVQVKHLTQVEALEGYKAGSWDMRAFGAQDAAEAQAARWRESLHRVFGSSEA